MKNYLAENWTIDIFCYVFLIILNYNVEFKTISASEPELALMLKNDALNEEMPLILINISTCLMIFNWKIIYFWKSDSLLPNIFSYSKNLLKTQMYKDRFWTNFTPLWKRVAAYIFEVLPKLEYTSCSI